MPFAIPVVQGRDWKDAIAFGIDLAGGTNLVYQIDTEKAEADGKPVTDELVERMVQAIGRRLDPAAQEQITVRRVGSDRIEVIIPGADPENVAKKKRDMTRLGKLEFAILANTRRHQSIIDQALASPDRDVRQGGRVVASWRPVAKSPDGKLKDVTARPGIEVSRVVERQGEEVTELLVVLEPPERRVTGEYLTKASPTLDPNGREAVSFTFNTRGGNLFASLTSEYQPETDEFKHRLAILLDDQIQSAPQLNDVISDQGQITGDFTRAEIDELVTVLNAGALQAPIIPDPVSEQTISPTLGADVTRRGLIAVAASGAVVLLIMLWYYRFAGFVADLCLILNLVMLMGAMSLIKSALTLPGIAGVVLTIGMAVDSNVLIYERMREELERGSSLRMAIQNGFHKALGTIIDSNLTTLLTALVLYIIGTDQIRGFAVTLIIGLVMSLFTALFFGRLVFDIAERKRWIKEIRMKKWVSSNPHLDFLKWAKPSIIASLVLIAAGMAALTARGKDNLDIDFTGGTMVSFDFVEDRKIDDVGQRLKQPEIFGPSISVELLSEAGEQQRGDTGKDFRLRTQNPGLNEVKEKVVEAFGPDALRRVTVEYGTITPIAAATESQGPEKGDDANKAEDAKKPDSLAATPENRVASLLANMEAVERERFTGGRQVELSFNDEIHATTAVSYFLTELEKIQTDGRPKYENAEALVHFEGTAGSGTTVEQGQVRTYSKFLMLASPIIDEADLKSSLAAMQQTMSENPTFEEVNTFAGSVASDMQKSALLAMFFSFVVMVAYIWFRFHSVTFGLAAVIGVVHDLVVVLALMVLASYASKTIVGRALLLSDFKINLELVAAFLTIAGYSINDTIVVFDRIREVRGKNPALTPQMVNDSVNQTLSRTLLTGATTMMVLLIMYIIGGEGLHGFSLCILLGILVGTYSSIFVASPVVLWLMNRPGSEAGMATAAALRRETAAAR
jgi:SecD/SecF fusion protein